MKEVKIKAFLLIAMIFITQRTVLSQEVEINKSPENSQIIRLSNSKLSNGEILIMNSSHQDLAWMNLLEKCILDRDTMLMTPLLEAASKDPGYRFDIEDVLMIKEYMARHPHAKNKIIQMLNDGRLSCGASYNMPYEEMYSGESLIRQFYLGARWAKENLGGYFPDTYWNPDVPGRTMQMSQIMAKSGVNKLLLSRHDKGVFKWYSPDGSFVYAYSPGHYYNDSQYLWEEPVSLDTLAKETLFWEKDYNNKPGIKPVIGILSDRDMSPARDFSQIISKWNSLNGYMDKNGEEKPLSLPEIKYALAPEFIDKIVKSSSDLKSIKGERPAVWVYIHGPSHEWALKTSREGDIMMTNAEKFSTIDALLRGTFRNYPTERLKKAWENKIYPDHGWGGNGGESTDAIFLSKFKESLSEAESITQEALNNIASRIKIDEKKGVPVVVFNSLSWKREDPVSFKINFDPGEAISVKLTDSEQKNIPAQLSDIETYNDGSIKKAKVTFIATGVPSIGYKTYYVIPLIDSYDVSLYNREDKIETPFYKIELGTGGVKSIFDKELNIELLNTRSILGGDVFTLKSEGFGAGEFADIQQPSMDGFDKVSNHSAMWEMIEKGAVYTTFKLRQPIRNAVVETKLTVYNNIKKIDFETSLMNWEGVLYREYRFALPLDMKNGKISYEVPFGILEVGKDEITGAAGERYTTNCTEVHPRGVENWIGASNNRFGVTLSTSTAVADYIDPTGLAGESLLLQPVMLASRRSCHGKGNEYLQTGNHEFHFSLTSHKPGYENGWKFGRQSNEKLLVVVDPLPGKEASLPEEKSFFSIDASNISISTIKKAEDDNSCIVRLYEMTGNDSNVTATVPFPIKGLWKTDLLESNETEIPSEEQSFQIMVGHHAIETYKVTMLSPINPINQHENEKKWVGTPLFQPYE